MLHMETQTLAVSMVGPLTGMCGTVGLVVERKMIIVAVVAKDGVVGSRIVMKLSLVFAVTKQMETNIHGFSLFEDDYLFVNPTAM